MKDNQSYYDEFALRYEDHRHQGYHTLLDQLEIDLVLKYANAQTVLLEAGCGTGLILKELAPQVKSATGVDLSPGMLEVARKRNLDVRQGSVTNLPFDSETFDVVCSFKVLAHVQEIRQAMQEMNRVLKPGGVMIAEFYNPFSFRYLVKKLKPPTAISDKTSDEAVFTRYDSLKTIRSYLPTGLKIEKIRGVRVLTPISQLHRVPFLGAALRWAEKKVADLPGLRRLGGFLIVVARKESREKQ